MVSSCTSLGHLERNELWYMTPTKFAFLVIYMFKKVLSSFNQAAHCLPWCPLVSSQMFVHIFPQVLCRNWCLLVTIGPFTWLYFVVVCDYIRGGCTQLNQWIFGTLEIDHEFREIPSVLQQSSFSPSELYFVRITNFLLYDHEDDEICWAWVEWEPSFLRVEESMKEKFLKRAFSSVFFLWCGELILPSSGCDPGPFVVQNSIMRVLFVRQKMRVRSRFV